MARKKKAAEPAPIVQAQGLVEWHGTSSVRIYRYWLNKLGQERSAEALVLGRLSFMDNAAYLKARARVEGGGRLL